MCAQNWIFTVLDRNDFLYQVGEYPLAVQPCVPSFLRNKKRNLLWACLCYNAPRPWPISQAGELRSCDWCIAGQFASRPITWAKEVGSWTLGRWWLLSFWGLVKVVPRSGVVLDGHQKSSAILPQKTLQWLLTLQNVPHKHEEHLRWVYLRSFMLSSLWFWTNFSFWSSHYVSLCTVLSV